MRSINLVPLLRGQNIEELLGDHRTDCVNRIMSRQSSFRQRRAALDECRHARSTPHQYLVVVPARSAYSHSASVGSRYVLPVTLLNHPVTLAQPLHVGLRIIPAEIAVERDRVARCASRSDACPIARCRRNRRDQRADQGLHVGRADGRSAGSHLAQSGGAARSNPLSRAIAGQTPTPHATSSRNCSKL